MIEDVCKKYACACTVKTATKPPQPIEKSTAGASLLAQVIVSKIADHLPVHRQAKILRRLGVEISDQTMCGWMRQSAELLDPLYERLKQFVLSSKVVGTDDTPVKVLDRSLEGTTRKGRFWPYLGDRDHGAAVFDYTPTRERAGPERVSRRAIADICRPMRMWPMTAFSPIRNGEWWRWPAGRTPDGISIRRWTLIRRAWVRCWPTIAQLYAVEKTARRAGVEGEELRLLREQGFSAGAGRAVGVSIEDSRSGVAEERSWAGGVVRTEELGSVDALLRRWRSIDRQQPHGADHARHRGRAELCAVVDYVQSGGVEVRVCWPGPVADCT